MDYNFDGLNKLYQCINFFLHIFQIIILLGLFESFITLTKVTKFDFGL
jgi:hypothetical protein